MSAASFFRLLCLAAIWGSSFLFMRIAAHSFGPAYLIEFRVLFAALSLLVVALYLKKNLAPLLHHPKHFLMIGLFNTALPFLCFAYAAQTLNASTLAVLNSTAVIWGVIISYLWYRTPISAKGVLGLLLGISGVVVLVGWDALQIGQQAILPIIAAVSAAFCYGIATNYTKNAPQIAAFDNAHGSMWMAVLLVLPLLPFAPMREMPSSFEMLSVTALGVLCTGIAYLMYFRLIAEIGPASALSVTFLIPAFGIFWGYLVLGEPIGLNTVAGTVLVLSGTMLVTGFSLKAALKPPTPKAGAM